MLPDGHEVRYRRAHKLGVGGRAPEELQLRLRGLKTDTNRPQTFESESCFPLYMSAPSQPWSCERRAVRASGEASSPRPRRQGCVPCMMHGELAPRLTKNTHHHSTPVPRRTLV